MAGLAQWIPWSPLNTSFCKVVLTRTFQTSNWSKKINLCGRNVKYKGKTAFDTTLSFQDGNPISFCTQMYFVLFSWLYSIGSKSKTWMHNFHKIRYLWPVNWTSFYIRIENIGTFDISKTVRIFFTQIFSALVLKKIYANMVVFTFLLTHSLGENIENNI